PHLCAYRLSSPPGHLYCGIGFDDSCNSQSKQRRPVSLSIHASDNKLRSNVPSHVYLRPKGGAINLQALVPRASCFSTRFRQSATIAITIACPVCSSG